MKKLLHSEIYFQLALDQFEDDQRHLGTNNVTTATADGSIPSTSGQSQSTSNSNSIEHQKQSNQGNHIQPPNAQNNVRRRNSQEEGDNLNIQQQNCAKQKEMDGHLPSGIGGGGEKSDCGLSQKMRLVIFGFWLKDGF